MPRSLRQHVAEALSILSCLGGPTILPSPANVLVRSKDGAEPLYRDSDGRRLPGSPSRPRMKNPKRQQVLPDYAGDKRDYAFSVLHLFDPESDLNLDRTGWAREYLMASDEAWAEVWRQIPTHRVCKLCFGRVPEPRTRRGRTWCAECGSFVESGKLNGLVSADLRDMRKALIKGGIPCATETGE